VVHINITYSKKQSITCGVPQGSILVPLLFSIYINDLPKASNFTTRLFADNTALIIHDKNLETLNVNITSELIKVEKWLNANKISLNYSKTKYLLIKPKTRNATLSDFHVTIKGIKLEKCKSAKYLGVVVDENLDWKPHIQNLQKKIARAVGIISKLRYYLNQKNLIIMYHAFFVHICYSDRIRKFSRNKQQIQW